MSFGDHPTLPFLLGFIQVRHAQGIHNVEGDKNYKAYMSPEYLDAQLTPLGWLQVGDYSCYLDASF